MSDCGVVSTLSPHSTLQPTNSLRKLARDIYMAFMAVLIRVAFNLFGYHCRKEEASREGKLISFDIAMEIISYLPASDVLMCKSVSKAWRDMLSTPYFENLHLHRAPVVTVLSFSFRPTSGSRFVPDSDKRKKKSPAVYPGFIKLPPYCWKPCGAEWLGCYNLITSCNGLFVMLKEDGSCYILNPALQEQVCLPRPPKNWHRMQLYHVLSSNQYKLIAITFLPDYQYLHFYVLTLGENKWRFLDYCWATEYSLSLDAPHLFRSRSNPYDNDKGWYIYSFNTKDRVLTFDVESEHLIEHDLPEEMKQFDQCTLTEFSERWEGYTAILFYGEDIVQVFMLEDYVKNIWVKKKFFVPDKLIELGRVMKNEGGNRPYHWLADHDGCVCFKDKKFTVSAFQVHTHKMAFNDSSRYGYIERVCPSKFSLVSCKGMSTTRKVRRRRCKKQVLN